MYGKVKNLFYNPACFRVDQKMTFFVRVFYIAQRCIGSIVCAIGKLSFLFFAIGSYLHK